jgi:hypothetical protein
MKHSLSIKQVERAPVIAKGLCFLLCFLASGCATMVDDFESGLYGRTKEDERKARVTEVNASPQTTYSIALSTIQEYGFSVQRAEGSLIVTDWTSANDLLSDAQWMLTVTVSPSSSGSLLSISGTVHYTTFAGVTHHEAVDRSEPPLLNKIEEIKWAIKKRAEGY